MSEVTLLGFAIEDKTSPGKISIVRNLGEVRQAAGRTGRDVDGLGSRLTRLRQRMLNVRSAAVALTGALGISALISYGDAWTSIGNRIALFTETTQQQVQIQHDLFQVAQDTRVAMGETVELYQRMARNADELGFSQRELLDVTRTINQTLIISGTSAASAQSALIQLGQGFASGVLRGQELNSVLEQAPRLARAFADGLGVPVGQLRKLGEEGQLTAQQLLNALGSQRQAIEQEFSQMSSRVDQAWTRTTNAVGRALDALEQKTGLLASVANAINSIADGISSSTDGFSNDSAVLAGVDKQLALLEQHEGRAAALENTLAVDARSQRRGAATEARRKELVEIRSTIQELEREIAQRQEMYRISQLTGQTLVDEARRARNLAIQENAVGLTHRHKQTRAAVDRYLVRDPVLGEIEANAAGTQYPGSDYDFHTPSFSFQRDKLSQETIDSLLRAAAKSDALKREEQEEARRLDRSINAPIKLDRDSYRADEAGEAAELESLNALYEKRNQLVIRQGQQEIETLVVSGASRQHIVMQEEGLKLVQLRQVQAAEKLRFLALGIGEEQVNALHKKEQALANARAETAVATAGQQEDEQALVAARQQERRTTQQVARVLTGLDPQLDRFVEGLVSLKDNVDLVFGENGVLSGLQVHDSLSLATTGFGLVAGALLGANQHALDYESQATRTARAQERLTEALDNYERTLDRSTLKELEPKADLVTRFQETVGALLDPTGIDAFFKRGDLGGAGVSLGQFKEQIVDFFQFGLPNTDRQRQNVNLAGQGADEGGLLFNIEDLGLSKEEFERIQQEFTQGLDAGILGTDGFLAALEGNMSRLITAFERFGKIDTSSFAGALDQFQHLQRLNRPDSVQEVRSLFEQAFAQVADVQFSASSATSFSPREGQELTAQEIRTARELIADIEAQAIHEQGQRVAKAVVDGHGLVEDAYLQQIDDEYSLRRIGLRREAATDARLQGANPLERAQAYQQLFAASSALNAAEQAAKRRAQLESRPTKSPYGLGTSRVGKAAVGGGTSGVTDPFVFGGYSRLPLDLSDRVEIEPYVVDEYSMILAGPVIDETAPLHFDFAAHPPTFTPFKVESYSTILSGPVISQTRRLHFDFATYAPTFTPYAVEDFSTILSGSVISQAKKLHFNFATSPPDFTPFEVTDYRQVVTFAQAPQRISLRSVDFLDLLAVDINLDNLVNFTVGAGKFDIDFGFLHDFNRLAIIPAQVPLTQAVTLIGTGKGLSYDIDFRFLHDFNLLHVIPAQIPLNQAAVIAGSGSDLHFDIDFGFLHDFGRLRSIPAQVPLSEIIRPLLTGAPKVLDLNDLHRRGVLQIRPIEIGLSQLFNVRTSTNEQWLREMIEELFAARKL